MREFGTGGKVDLTAGVSHLEGYRWTAAPLICRDTVIVGIFTIDQFDRRDQAPADIRGYDVVTGQLKWRFNTIPQPGEFGHETWEDGSWEHTGTSNVWTVASADEEGHMLADRRPWGRPPTCNQLQVGERRGRRRAARAAANHHPLHLGPQRLRGVLRGDLSQAVGAALTEPNRLGSLRQC